MASKSLMRFEFESVGPKGIIRKKIEFDRFSSAFDVYNLAFGDVNKNGEIDDLVVTDNDDGQKVLVTVSSAVNQFLQKHPNSHIYASGSTPARSRLYRISISNNLEEIQRNFIIYGFANNRWESFEKNKNYEEFLISLKNKTVHLSHDEK